MATYCPGFIKPRRQIGRDAEGELAKGSLRFAGNRLSLAGLEIGADAWMREEQSFDFFQRSASEHFHGAGRTYASHRWIERAELRDGQLADRIFKLREETEEGTNVGAEVSVLVHEAG